MENIKEVYDSEMITSIINKSFMTIALQYNLTKENAPKHPAFINSDVIMTQLNRGFKMYGYFINEQLVGCVGYWTDDGGINHIERLATLPEHRHLGIGKKLMEFVENKIMENRGKIAEVHVLDKNTTLIQWYKKMEYTIIRIDELKHLPFNSCVMNKILT